MLQAQYEFIHKTLKETMDRLETYSNFWGAKNYFFYL